MEVLLFCGHKIRLYLKGRFLLDGGISTGNGGLVETSSQRDLNVDKGKVDARGFQGKLGQWFLDPFLVHIKSSGDSMAKCSSCSSDPYHCYMAASVFQNLMSDITIDPMEDLHSKWICL